MSAVNQDGPVSARFGRQVVSFDSEAHRLLFEVLRTLRIADEREPSQQGHDAIWLSLDLPVERVRELKDQVDDAAFSKGFVLQSLRPDGKGTRLGFARDQAYAHPRLETQAKNAVDRFLRMAVGEPAIRTTMTSGGYQVMKVPADASLGPVHQIAETLRQVDGYGGTEAFLTLPADPPPSGLGRAQLEAAARGRLSELMEPKGVERALSQRSTAQLESLLAAAGTAKVALQAYGRPTQADGGSGWDRPRDWQLQDVDFRGPRGKPRLIFRVCPAAW